MAAGQGIQFEEVQRFRQPALWGLLVGVGVVLVGGLVRGHGFTQPGGWFLSGLFLAIYVGVLILMFWMRLETRVEPDGVCVQFFPLHRRPVRIEVDPTHAVEAVMYSPLREYGGWGVRHELGGGGLAYTVSGSWGVRLRQPEGRALLIGSQRAEALADAIRTHCAGMPSRPGAERTGSQKVS